MPKTQHVYALFETSQAANAAIASIEGRGCSSEHCSAILHERHLDESVLPNGERASGEGARDGALAGGAAGLVLGGLAALGGSLLGAGPLAAVVAGGILAGYSAVAGGLAGADVPEKHLRAIQAELESGKILIAVETDDPELERMCAAVFVEHGGQPVVF